jgi:hypothetical protein
LAILIRIHQFNEFLIARFFSIGKLGGFRSGQDAAMVFIFEDDPDGDARLLAFSEGFGDAGQPNFLDGVVARITCNGLLE